MPGRKHYNQKQYSQHKKTRQLKKNNKQAFRAKIVQKVDQEEKKIKELQNVKYISAIHPTISDDKKLHTQRGYFQPPVVRVNEKKDGQVQATKFYSNSFFEDIKGNRQDMIVQTSFRLSIAPTKDFLEGTTYPVLFFDSIYVFTNAPDVQIEAFDVLSKFTDASFNPNQLSRGECFQITSQTLISRIPQYGRGFQFLLTTRFSKNHPFADDKASGQDLVLKTLDAILKRLIIELKKKSH